MNIRRTLDRFAPLGVLRRVVRSEEDMPTTEGGDPWPPHSGLNIVQSAQSFEDGGTVTFSTSVRMAFITSVMLREIVGAVEFQPTGVIISEQALAANGYPLPVERGDIASLEGQEVTIRQALVKEWRGQKVFVCQAEG